MNKILIFITIISTAFFDVGGMCEEKYILTPSNTLHFEPIGDGKLVFNKAASCVSLKTGDDYSACCYAKLKLTNDYYDEKFTHEGCVRVSGDDLIGREIKDYIKELEGKVTDNYKLYNVTKTKISIDCNSNYLKYSALLLLAFLL